MNSTNSCYTITIKQRVVIVIAKRLRTWNQTKFEKYIKDGRGRGAGADYLPWITVHDFSSRGIVSRVKGIKTQRVHHFLSRNELYYFYLLDWSDSVLDIREQFPLLNVELAVEIAQNAGIKYPYDNISGFPYIMTCDFMITTPQGLKARTIKCSSELSNKRVLEKLEIERRYWDKLNIDWRMITESEIPVSKAKYIESIHTSAISSGEWNESVPHYGFAIQQAMGRLELAVNI